MICSINTNWRCTVYGECAYHYDVLVFRNNTLYTYDCFDDHSYCFIKKGYRAKCEENAILGKDLFDIQHDLFSSYNFGGWLCSVYLHDIIEWSSCNTDLWLRPVCYVLEKVNAMNSFVMEVAGLVVRVTPIFETTKLYCRDYLSAREPDCEIHVDREDLVREQELLDIEALEEGLKRRKFADPFLARSVIQRRTAQMLVEKDTLMVHGSTVGLDGNAYLFTAPCGTGKSTHTRLWREAFGERAVMVNDDKPFLQIGADGVTACGSPWTGKHGLGSNVCFPLRGICILSRGPENRIQPLALEAAAEFLLSQCFIPDDPVWAQRARSLLMRLLELVPLWQMECTKDPTAALVSSEAMT